MRDVGCIPVGLFDEASSFVLGADESNDVIHIIFCYTFTFMVTQLPWAILKFASVLLMFLISNGLLY